MADAAVIAVVVAVAAGLGYAIHRFYPDSRAQLGPDLDDALYRGGVRGLWIVVGVGAVCLLLAWLLL